MAGSLPAPDAHALAALAAAHPQLAAEIARRADSKFRRYFPDDGPLRRALYPQHLAFMAAGAQHRERVFLAANRIGKTDTAAYEVAAHMTGLYPAWWTGRRFDHPTSWWFAGDTMLTTRDIIQVALLGAHDGVPRREWTGMLPPWRVHHITRKTGGVANCVEDVYVAWSGPDGTPTGQLSRGQFKSYDQGRRSFQGTAQDGTWLDEEPPDANEEGTSEIYTECLLRTMTTEGLLMSTFTPLRGLTTFIAQYLQDAEMPDGQGGTENAMKHFWPDEDAA